nr:pp21 [Homo sapiens]AAD17840.1 transcription elongation factor A SII-like 1 [Homo sapiens]
MDKPRKENEEEPQSRPRPMRRGLRWSTLPKSSPPRSSLRRSSPRRRSSFLRSSCLSSCLRCSSRRTPSAGLSRKDLFEVRPPMEQPPCGVGKHNLEEGIFKERLARSRPQFRGDIHGRNLSNEEMIQAADELEEMKRVRNKLMIMHWRAKRGGPYPI